ncbi:hypothetical protein ACFFTN_21495 [Aminobacter aganoensis]|uniref:Uncharacterized protein n=1 Tax=Aminobacter aganoensis TaxID=83264 RepID=A0A7X0FCC6_9HYPH|nr:hypothetical protein [Aminobacter aganoensis]MBB6357137.1 hypothetical protein [Aminobacter aganoensis]
MAEKPRDIRVGDTITIEVTVDQRLGNSRMTIGADAPDITGVDRRARHAGGGERSEMSDEPTDLARIIAMIDKLNEAKAEAANWPMLRYLIDSALHEATQEFQAIARRELERAGGLN